MKKRLSILMLAARFTVYRVILLLLGMSIVQVGLFWLALGKEKMAGLNVLLENNNNGWVAVIGFILLCVLLGKSVNGSGGAMNAYTIDRLSVGEIEFTGWFALYNGLMFLVFWLWEALTLLSMCMIYMWQVPQEVAVGPQTIFLASYRVEYLHRLIPLADISGWVRNGAFIVAMGICTAANAYHERGGRRGVAIWFAAAIALWGIWNVNDGNRTTWTDVMLVAGSMLVAAIAVYTVISKEREIDKGGDRWVSGN